MDEDYSSKLFNLAEMFRNSHHARKIMQATQPIFEEFSTSLRTVGFSNETEVTYATSFFSQVGFSAYNSGSHLPSASIRLVELWESSSWILRNCAKNRVDIL